MRGDHLGLRWALHLMISVLIRDKKEDKGAEKSAKPSGRQRWSDRRPQPGNAWSYQKL